MLNKLLFEIKYLGHIIEVVHLCMINIDFLFSPLGIETPKILHKNMLK